MNNWAVDLPSIYKNEKILGEITEWVWDQSKFYKDGADTKIWLVIPGVDSKCYEDVIDHMLHRVPVYMTGPGFASHINELEYEKFQVDYQRVHSYDTKQFRMPNLECERYGVLGEASVKIPQESDSYRIKGSKFYWLHIWAFNLEWAHETNVDYTLWTEALRRNSVKQALGLAQRVYLKNAQIVALSLLNIAHKDFTKTKTNICNLHVHLVGVGMGVYIKNAGEHADDLREYFYHITKLAIQCVVDSIQIPIYVSVPCFKEDSVSFTNVWKFVHTGSPIQIATPLEHADPRCGPARERIFSFDHSLKNLTTLTLNAWDDRSFIGNGHASDDTADGWTTSRSVRHWKARTFSHLDNSSFWHNLAVLYPGRVGMLHTESFSLLMTQINNTRSRSEPVPNPNLHRFLTQENVGESVSSTSGDDRQIDEPKHCLKILVIQDCPGLENAIWNMSKLRSVDLLTRYYGPQFNEMSIDYKPLYLIDPMSVCGQYVAIIIDFACLPETVDRVDSMLSGLGVMLNPNCPEPLILISGVDHQNKGKKFEMLLIIVDHFRLAFEMVEDDIMIVYCVRGGTPYTKGQRAVLEMRDVRFEQKLEVRDTTMGRIKDGHYDTDELEMYLQNSYLFQSQQSKRNDRLLGTLDVLAVPTRADFSAAWVPLIEYVENENTEKPFYLFKSKHPFHILHAAAPNVGETCRNPPQDIDTFRLGNGQFATQRYLNHYRQMMENVFNAAHFLKLQHLILHPFGMGAFIRNLHCWVKPKVDWHEGSEKKNQLRSLMVNEMVKALETNAPRPFMCHMCYPLPERDSPEEHENNKKAIEAAMTNHNNIKLEPGVDALALANHIASMGLPVGMLNSANANRIGNKWDDNGARFAIDENIHRRSHMLCLTSRAFNKDGMDLMSKVNQNGGKVYSSKSVATYLANTKL